MPTKEQYRSVRLHPASTVLGVVNSAALASGLPASQLKTNAMVSSQLASLGYHTERTSKPCHTRLNLIRRSPTAARSGVDSMAQAKDCQ